MNNNKKKKKKRLKDRSIDQRNCLLWTVSERGRLRRGEEVNRPAHMMMMIHPASECGFLIGGWSSQWGVGFAMQSRNVNRLDRLIDRHILR